MRRFAPIAVLALLACPPMAMHARAQVTNPAPPATASAPDQPMDLQTYLKRPDYQSAILESARNQMKQVDSACPASALRPNWQPTVIDPPRFSGGKPLNGVWTERVEVHGCGALRALNILTIIHEDGKAQIVGMMPGDTHTDTPMMQKNALQYAEAVAVRAAPPGCKHLAFVDTKFNGFVGAPSPEVTDGRESRPWREVWTISACGALYDVPLRFTPNARGTALAGENPVKHPG